MHARRERLSVHVSAFSCKCFFPFCYLKGGIKDFVLLVPDYCLFFFFTCVVFVFNFPAVLFSFLCFMYLLRTKGT